MTDTATSGKDIAAIEAAMEADGVPTSTAVQADYWGTDVTKNVLFPDGITFVTIKLMDEGARSKYQNDTQRDVRLNRVSGDAHLKMAAAEERHALLKASIVGWNLTKNGQPYPFSKAQLEEWLKVAPTGVVDLIEKEIRKLNPWLMGDVSADELRKQISELQELLETKEREEEGNASS